MCHWFLDDGLLFFASRVGISFGSAWTHKPVYISGREWRAGPSLVPNAPALCASSLHAPLCPILLPPRTIHGRFSRAPEMTTHDTMADLSALNPILVLPLASPASAHFTVTSLKSSPLWNCDLLKPARGRSASYFTTPDNGSIGQNDPCAEALICDGRRKLSELLTHNPTPLHAKPSALLSPIDLLSPRAFLSISSETPLTSPLRHTMPAHGHPHNHSRPTTSGHKSKTPRSSFRIRQRTPKSTLSRSLRMAAPAPRIPLASVLQSWAAHDAQATPYSGDVMEVDGEEWRSYGWDRAPETSPAQPRSRGLGLLLGFSPPTFARTRASHSHSHSREQRQAEGESQSHIHDSAARTKFSRRLRRLAPAPLQLASSTSHRAAPYVSSQALSPHAQCTSTPVTFYDVPMDNSGAQNIDPTPAPASEDIPSLNLSPSLDNSQRSPRNLITNAFSGMAARFRTRTKSTSSPTSHDFPMNSRMSIDHHNMIPKCTNPDMTDTNANSNQSPCTPTHPTHVDADPSVSYLDLMSWRRSVSRALDTPLSPGFAAEYTPKSIPVPVPVLVPAAHNLPPTPRHRPQPAQTQNPTTPGAPPQVRRQWFVPLPQSPVRDENQWDWDGDAGARADLRLDLDAEDLAQRAEKCAEAISRASFVSLRTLEPLSSPVIVLKCHARSRFAPVAS